MLHQIRKPPFGVVFLFGGARSVNLTNQMQMSSGHLLAAVQTGGNSIIQSSPLGVLLNQHPLVGVFFLLEPRMNYPCQ